MRKPDEMRKAEIMALLKAQTAKMPTGRIAGTIGADYYRTKRLLTELCQAKEIMVIVETQALYWKVIK